MATLRRMTSNIAAQVFSLLASMIDKVLLVGLLLRGWGADVFADYSVIQSAASLLLLCELGMQLYFQNAQQAAFVSNDKTAFRRMCGIHASSIAAMVGGATALLLVAVAAGAGSRFPRMTAVDATSAREMLLLFGIGNLMNALRSTTTTIYTAAGDFAYVVVIGAVFASLTTGVSAVAVFLGAGPVGLAAIFFVVGGVVPLIYCAFDTRRRYPGWVAGPVLPIWRELAEAARHVKWYASQIFAQAIWLQIPVLVLAGWGETGKAIASFLLTRTLVNLIRQFFQFAAVGAGLEIAALAHGRDYDRAWRLTARVGFLTSIASAAAFAGVLCFGQNIIFLWTGGAARYSPVMAFALLAPLLLVAPLQQPIALLQYANVSREPGLLRVLQICLGPVFCIAGQAIDGANGLAIGLALAEIFAAWAILPLLARLPMFDDLIGYYARALAAAIAVAAVSALVGFGLTATFPSLALIAIAGKIAAWILLTLSVSAVLALRRDFTPMRDVTGLIGSTSPQGRTRATRTADP